MRTDIVFTLTGPDRVGIVEEVARELLDLGGNVEASRMSRLGGEFAILMLVSMPTARVDDLDSAFSHLEAQGYRMTAGRAHKPGEQAPSACAVYRIDVEGADHEGIIHQIAARLAPHGISIESMETAVQPAPVSGAPLFSMTAHVAVPSALAESAWVPEVVGAGEDSNVDVRVARDDA